MNYLVARAGSVDELIGKVNEHCRHRWVPLGGITFDSTAGKHAYLQAMTKA